MRLIAAGERLAREVDELRIELAVEVLLQVNGTGLRSMDQLSKRQRQIIASTHNAKVSGPSRR
ncbi:hypothetical protein ACIQUC_08465 [Curtobacterium sp. NPDC098951]|uniref:hypothetical protein n=1 Tax=Curtobacterium sp. NPDC098951 TaxID=3363974 RepID=UPI0038309809